MSECGMFALNESSRPRKRRVMAKVEWIWARKARKVNANAGSPPLRRARLEGMRWKFCTRPYDAPLSTSHHGRPWYRRKETE